MLIAESESCSPFQYAISHNNNNSSSNNITEQKNQNTARIRPRASVYQFPTCSFGIAIPLVCSVGGDEAAIAQSQPVVTCESTYLLLLLVSVYTSITYRHSAVRQSSVYFHVTRSQERERSGDFRSGKKKSLCQYRASVLKMVADFSSSKEDIVG